MVFQGEVGGGVLGCGHHRGGGGPLTAQQEEALSGAVLPSG